ncbi:MAG: nucleoside-diphosphate-sugar epimerase [Bacteroidia bacterium]
MIASVIVTAFVRYARVEFDGERVTPEKPTLLLLGCGQLGISLGEHYLQRGWKVVGARRNADKVPAEFSGLAMDFCNAAAVLPLKDIVAEYVVITLTPGGRSEEAYQRIFEEGLSNLLPALNRDSIKHVLFTSSTSVYHQNDGSVVDETSPTLPETFSGRAVLAAERLLAASGLPHSHIRFGGIYGGDSLRLAERVRAGKCAPAVPVHYSNRIHRLDCVRVLQHLIDRHRDGRVLENCYLAVDSAPAPIAEVHRWLAEQIQAEYKADAGYQHMAGSKRGNNQRLLDSGFEFLYPDYRSGYQAVLART